MLYDYAERLQTKAIKTCNVGMMQKIKEVRVPRQFLLNEARDLRVTNLRVRNLNRGQILDAIINYLSPTLHNDREMWQIVTPCKNALHRHNTTKNHLNKISLSSSYWT